MSVILSISGYDKLKRVSSVDDMMHAFEKSFHMRGQSALIKLQERFSAVLRPGASEDVGASGRAAENITGAVSGTSLLVFEGTGTYANYLIRQGIPPGSKVPIEKLRTWAADKGVKLYYDPAKWDGSKATSQRSPNAVLDKLTSTRGISFTRSRWFGRVGIKPKSSLKPSQVAEKGLYALRWVLFKYGTNRPSANWLGLPPGGAGRFDYPGYVLKKDSAVIKAIIEEFGGHVAGDLGNRIFTGE